MENNFSRLEILRLKKKRYKITDKMLSDRCKCHRTWVNWVLNEKQSSKKVLDTLEIMIQELEQSQLKTK